MTAYPILRTEFRDKRLVRANRQSLATVSRAPAIYTSKETYLSTGGFIVEKFVITSLTQKMLPDEMLG
ncbi:hypothetical protein PENSUB_4608 [Penicillium subrubescens]|uniref:Uncharacterized protein n=1 Tax=Penicillium subrubescens TaxID=1316194 RepID=A0A1Q5UBY1_9EURO|nr:hypothetical protein PENSUB_4608 [Penicillium subrubescens]